MRFLALIGALAIAVGIGAGVFFFGGFFNVAASEQEPEPVKWLLTKVRMASISRHAAPNEMPADQGSVQSGAKAYLARGCANCHGAPGVGWQKFSEGLNPDPPNLNYVVKDRSPGELFVVVRDGIKMTGMPSFKNAGVDDKEIWWIVAFLKKLPDVKEADFKAWTATP